MAVHEKFCAWCGRRFLAARSDATYCSATCRQRHKRDTQTRVYEAWRRGDYDYEGKPPGESEVVAAVLDVKRAAALLSAAAVSGPNQYRAVCSRLGHALEDVLEVEGL